jgi:hypothetical protein
VLKLEGGRHPILPPASDLKELEIKGKRRGDTRLNGFFHLLCKTIFNAETDLPVRVCAPYLDIANRTLLRKGHEGDCQNEQEDKSSRHPTILKSIDHDGQISKRPQETLKK